MEVDGCVGEGEGGGDEEVVGCSLLRLRTGKGLAFRHARPLMLISPSLSPGGGVKRHYPLPSFSLYRELVPRMRNCLKLLAPPHCTPLQQH